MTCDKDKLDLFVSGHNTKLFEQSITYKSVLIYNKLPHEIKSVTCIMKFKKMITEPESSLPYSQAPATCPYPEPTPSSPHNPFPLPEDPS